MGLTASSQALGMLAGTLGAGLLIRWFDWEAVFLGRTPFAVLALLLALRYMPRERRSPSGPPCDLLGAATLLGAVVDLAAGTPEGRSLAEAAETIHSAKAWACQSATADLLTLRRANSRSAAGAWPMSFMKALEVFMPCR